MQGLAQSDKKTMASGYAQGNKYAQGRNLFETEDEKL